jgi:SAM-dependent methyltransferase
MRCICCLSNKITPNPFNLDGFFCCFDCGFIFKPNNKLYNQEAQLIHHYENVDPHVTVANSKRPFFNFVLNHLPAPVNKNNSILDVGCGYGYFLVMADKRGWQTAGVEIVKEAVQSARKVLGKNNIFHGTLKEAFFPDNSFDVVTLWDVLVFAEDPFEELKKCYQTLRIGGKIGIRIRNVTFQIMVYTAFLPFKKIAARFGIKNPYVFHRNCFSHKSIYRLLIRLGFTRIQITNSPITYGDPYGYFNIKGLAKLAKYFISIISKIFFWLSSGRWLIGPSILVWGEKPQSDPEKQTNKFG